MKKEFIDYMYDLRATLIYDIGVLEEASNEPVDEKCKDCSGGWLTELKSTRRQLKAVDEMIEKYFDTHSTPK